MTGVRLRDVAEHAGVSISAASICLRHGEGFAAQTIARVRLAADELGYAVPSGVRSPKAERAGVVGVVLHDSPVNALRCAHTLEILRGLARELTPMGLGIELLPAGQGPATAGAYENAQVDMVFYLSLAEPAHATADGLRMRGIPTVHLQSTVDGPIAAVRTDDVTPMRDLMSHVTGMGHERIAVLTQSAGPAARRGLVADARWESAQVTHTRDRLRGIAEAGVVPYAVFEAAASSIDDGLEAGRVLLDLYPRPTAVVCFSDMLAAGVMVAARERSLKVPEELSVTGWDGVDLPTLAPHRLTTVLQSGTQKGMLLAAFGAAVLAGRTPTPFRLPQYVSLGTTTGPVP
jgi:DNA-binding LacI/PurR family transcriptional regulator